MLKTFVSGPMVLVAILIVSGTHAVSAFGQAPARMTVPTLAAVLTSARSRASVGDETATVMPVSSVVTPAIAGLPPVLSGPADPYHGPVNVLGNTGGTELIGGMIGIVLLLRYARRRRLI